METKVESNLPLILKKIAYLEKHSLVLLNQILLGSDLRCKCNGSVYHIDLDVDEPNFSNKYSRIKA